MQLVAVLHAEKMYEVPNSLRVISDRWASCCQRQRQEGCERKAVAASKKTVAFFLSLQQQQQHHPPPAAATSGGPPCPTVPPLLFGGCKDGENRFFCCLFVCLFVFTLTVRLSVPLACVRQRALAVQFEEVLFRQLYEATFNDEKVAWVVLTIE